MQKRLYTAILAAAICAQTMAAFAAEGIGPGYETPPVSETPATETPAPTAYEHAWEKVDGVYMDDTGKAIEGAVLRGVSVSKWQGDINWNQVAADDIKFALIRMGSFGYEGEYTMDEYFDKNMREARANGIHTSPYIYLQTRTTEEAREAARYAVEQASKYAITYPIAADIESEYIMSLSTQELTDIVNAFCQVIKEAGYTPIVYSDYYKFNNEMFMDQIPYDFWLARYGGDHNMPRRTMWQSTDKGRVDGIQGNVCLEFAFMDYAASAGQGNGGSTYGPGSMFYAGWNQTPDGSWYYYQNGAKSLGWIQPDGNWYYLDPAADGKMVSDVSMVIDGVEYSFDGSGVMQ